MPTEGHARSGASRIPTNIRQGHKRLENLWYLAIVVPDEMHRTPDQQASTCLVQTERVQDPLDIAHAGMR